MIFTLVEHVHRHVSKSFVAYEAWNEQWQRSTDFSQSCADDYSVDWWRSNSLVELFGRPKRKGNDVLAKLCLDRCSMKHEHWNVVYRKCSSMKSNSVTKILFNMFVLLCTASVKHVILNFVHWSNVSKTFVKRVEQFYRVISKPMWRMIKSIAS